MSTAEDIYGDIYSDNWEPETTTVVVQPEVTTSQVTKNTVMNCPKCGGKNYLKDGKCARCDHHLV